MPLTEIYIEAIDGGFAVRLNSSIGAEFFELFGLTLAQAVEVVQAWADKSGWCRHSIP